MTTKYKSSEEKIKYMKEWRKRNPEKCRINHLISWNRYKEKNNNKIKARKKVNNEIRAGRIVKMSCEKCGNTKSESHHEDYSKPLKIMWLCKTHHFETHNK